MQEFGRLRPAANHDVDVMLQWRNHPSVRKNMNSQHEITTEEHRKWWASVSDATDQVYLIYECNNISLGVVAFTKIDRFNRNCAWAFYGAPDAPWGTGSKMEYLALEYAFDTLKLKKLFCEVLSYNVNVLRLHNKFGFHNEGILRCHKLINEQFVDVYQLGILREEWEERSVIAYEELAGGSKYARHQD